MLLSALRSFCMHAFFQTYGSMCRYIRINYQWRTYCHHSITTQTTLIKKNVYCLSKRRSSCDYCVLNSSKTKVWEEGTKNICRIDDKLLPTLYLPPNACFFCFNGCQRRTSLHSSGIRSVDLLRLQRITLKIDFTKKLSRALNRYLKESDAERVGKAYSF